VVWSHDQRRRLPWASPQCGTTKCSPLNITTPIGWPYSWPATNASLAAIVQAARLAKAAARGCARADETSTRPATDPGRPTPLPSWRYGVSAPVRIPADVDMPDRVIGTLTARQVTILAVTGLMSYVGWSLTHSVVPVPVLVALAIPLGAVATVLTLGQRDGISLDRMLLAALRQRMAPRHYIAAAKDVHPAPAWLTTRASGASVGRAGNHPTTGYQEQLPRSVMRLPAKTVTDTGIIDLGSDGLALVAVASTVNFALRTTTEQQALIASFGSYLHSLAAPVQVLVRTLRLDLSAQITDLRRQADGLAHPALETAAIEHAEFLTHLSERSELLRRQVLLVFREDLRPQGSPTNLGSSSATAMLGSLIPGRPRVGVEGEQGGEGARRAAEARLVHRLGDAIELLAPAGIVVTALDAGQASAVLAAACNPDTLLPLSRGHCQLGIRADQFGSCYRSQ
jgi:PrgI family protein